ncbi:unnamed protein product [Phaeothamnion confervicola]
MVDWAGEGKVMPDFRKIEAGQHAELPIWAMRQKKVFTNWLNNKLAERQLKVEELFLDLQDGVVLYNLLEVLSKQSLAVLGKVRPERNKIKKIANMNIVWKYLGNTVRLVGIGPNDIVDGHATLTLGMIWSLIVFFMAKDLGDAGEGLAELKRRIMDWLKKRTKNYPDVNVTNFTDSFADGKAFLALLNDVDPQECPYDPSPSPADNMHRAFDRAQRLYGVGAILDPDDPHATGDEKAMITYLAELMKSTPEAEVNGSSFTDKPSRVADPKRTALEWTEAHEDDWLARLKELCKYRPDDAGRCADKVAQFMGEAGLENVRILTPSHDKVDPSGRRAPFVVGEKLGPPGGPTVLIYATYGTDRDGPDEERKWTTDPFDAIVDAAGSGGGRLAAKGAAADKAAVVAPLAAVEALLKSPAATGLPVTLRVLIGGTPPASALAGDRPLDVCDKLAEFLRAHPGDVGSPDVVIVSEPHGSALAPEKSAVLYGCRGFASVNMAVRTFSDEAGKKRSCADYSGPLIDPGAVLAAVLASLHDPNTGALAVEALQVTPDKAASDALRHIQYGEHHLRPVTGYHPEMPCAKEFYVRDNVHINATVVEQLTLLPAVTVTGLSMGDGPAGGNGEGNGCVGAGGGLIEEQGPLSARFRQVARASLHMALAPGQDAAAALRALQQHCGRAAPHGAKLEFTSQRAHCGWFTHPSLPIVEAMAGSRLNESSGRGTVVVGCPDFRPLPVAFADALPAAKVVAAGVNDGRAAGGLANESVALSDVRDFVRNTIHLLHHLASPPKKGGPDTAPRDERTAYAGSKMDEMDRRNAPANNAGRAAAAAGAGAAATSLSPARSHHPLTPPPGSPAGPAAGGALSPGGGALPMPPSPGSASMHRTRSSGGDFGSALSVNGRKGSITAMGPGGMAGSPGGGGYHVGGSHSPTTSLSPARRGSGESGANGGRTGGSGQCGGGSYREGMVTGASHHGGLGANKLDSDGAATPEAVVAEINMLRSSPTAYAAKLEALAPTFDGNTRKVAGVTELVMSEGIAALHEAVLVLRQSAPLPPLARVAGLDAAAADHARDLCGNGRMGHVGADGSKTADRLNRYGQWHQIAGEVISYFDNTPRGVVAHLLLADNDRTRHTRKAVLADHFRVVGVATGSHPTAASVCVVTLAGGFGPKPLEQPASVVCQAGAAPSAEFRRVLESVPVSQVIDEIEKALAANQMVEIDYKPGEVTLAITQDGGKATMKCTW